MALQPSLSFTKIGHGPNTLEIWLDILCPFSAKITFALDAKLVPALLDPSTEFSKSVTLLIRPYTQPWHPAGTFAAEAALAFGRSSSLQSLKSPDEQSRLWWAFFVKLMREQERWFDMSVKDKTPDQIRDELAGIAGEVLQSSNAIKGPASKAVGEIRDLIAVKSNSGTAVTADLKYFVKLGRQNAIHVTPSACLNGIFESSVSSSWTDEQWNEYFKSKGIATF